MLDSSKMFPLSDKQLRQLHKLLRAEGLQFDSSWSPDRIHAEWMRYQSMTKAGRDRLYAQFSLMQKTKQKLDSDRYVANQLTENIDISSSNQADISSNSVDLPASTRRQRGSGKNQAMEPYTLLVQPRVLSDYRNLADRLQRPMSELIRLAMIDYLVFLDERHPELVNTYFPKSVSNK